MNGREGAGWSGAALQLKYCSGEVFDTFTLDASRAFWEREFCVPEQAIVEVTSGSHDEDVAWEILHEGSVVLEGGAPFSHSISCGDT